jgi:hypothetical protein
MFTMLIGLFGCMLGSVISRCVVLNLLTTMGSSIGDEVVGGIPFVAWVPKV